MLYHAMSIIDLEPSVTEITLLDKYEYSHLMKLFEKFSLFIFSKSIVWLTLSKAFDKSKRMTTVNIFLSIALLMSPTNFNKQASVPYPDLYPY